MKIRWIALTDCAAVICTRERPIERVPYANSDFDPQRVYAEVDLWDAKHARPME